MRPARPDGELNYPGARSNAARASAKVGSGFEYQLACWGEAQLCAAMLMSPERDQREQASKAGVCGDRQIGPSALGLDAEVATNFGEGDLHTSGERTSPGCRGVGRQIGAQKGLRTELLLAVPHQHVADQDAPARTRPDAVPVATSTWRGAAVPARNLQAMPARLRIRHPLLQGGQTAPDKTGPAGPGPARRGRLVQAGIQAQPSDHTEPGPQR